jgi:carbonic anhydrase/acetyltransferase-like protein (isoleucine patch superfamily)
MALILPHGDKRPRVAPDAYIAPNATLIGDVTIAAGASVWFGAVLRGDDEAIRGRLSPWGRIRAIGASSAG